MVDRTNPTAMFPLKPCDLDVPTAHQGQLSTALLEPHHGQVVVVGSLAQPQLLLLSLTHALQHAVEHVIVAFIGGLGAEEGTGEGERSSGKVHTAKKIEHGSVLQLSPRSPRAACMVRL